ncbi:galactose-specific lectin nattectin-like [Saccostrea cucullata]|uniref:galactose-specific lectin nattectin-like n=1 Tax=Saccostrea cuccullata TaxID=36930 RepID=UPI002ED3A6E9
MFMIFFLLRLAEVYTQSLTSDECERCDVRLSDMLRMLKSLQTQVSIYREENMELKSEIKKLSKWQNNSKASVCSVERVHYRGHSYRYHKSKMNWTDAQIACEKEGAYLVEIEDNLESEWITDMFLKKDLCSTYDGQCMVWTGGNDRDTEGVFKWSHSKNTFQFTNWNTKEPSIGSLDVGSYENCLSLLPVGYWNDALCSWKFDFLCERSIHDQMCQDLS